MKEAINTLKRERNALQHCLDDKTWASDESEYHKSIRQEYKQRVKDLHRAIQVLSEENSQYEIAKRHPLDDLNRALREGI